MSSGTTPSGSIGPVRAGRFPRWLRISVVWGFGVGLALIAGWGIGWGSVNSQLFLEYSPELGRNVPMPGLVYRESREGRGVTRYGALGVPGIAEIRAVPGRKLLLLGDSHVAAHEVGDGNRISDHLTRLLSESAGERLTAFSVGRGYWSVADYYFQIPKFERAVPDLAGVIILVSGLGDTLPDQDPLHQVSMFHSRPHFRFEYFEIEGQEDLAPIRHSALRGRVAALQPQFLLRLRNRVREGLNPARVRFRPGPVASRKPQPGPSEGPAPNPAGRDAAWEWMFRQLREVTRLPVIFVHVPPAPETPGKALLPEDLRADDLQRFAEIGADFGIPVLAAGPAFARERIQSGEFLRGFPTSAPGLGHLNARGHRVVAEVIAQWIEEHPDAF